MPTHYHVCDLLIVIAFNLVSFFFWLDPKEAKSQGPQKRQVILLANYHLSFLMAGEALSENFTFSTDNSDFD